MVPEAHLQSACCELVADVARREGKVQLKVAGTSMVPALLPGDVVTVRSCNAAELKPGSIVVFRKNNRLVTHRFVRRVDVSRDREQGTGNREQGSGVRDRRSGVRDQRSQIRDQRSDGCPATRMLTRGDARLRYDAPVEAGEVLGQVESVVRNGRPVDLRRSLWHRVLGPVLRRSEGCTRIYLRVSSRMRKLGVAGSDLVKAGT